MDESESRNEKPKEGRRFSQEQYDMLKRCSDKKDMTEWNEWRRQHPDETILLDRRSFHGFYLSGAFLNTGAVVINPGTRMAQQWIFRGEVHLRGSLFLQAKLRGTDFRGAHIEGSTFNFAELEGGCLELAYLQGTTLKGATFDKRTFFEGCHIDKQTDFRESDLASLRVSPRIRQLMEYNVRRMNWEEWYKEQHWSLRWMVRKFWKISDYGISTKQIIKTFFKLAFVFAIIYYIWGFIDYYLVGIKDYPGIVSDLFVLEDYQEAVSCWLVPFRAVYFSVVTMTTLGFGDMYANAHSFFRGLLGHVLLALQVILGYVLLGALVTRFAVLFTAGGPAGTFSKEKKK